jgi:hypothetical protein
MKPKIGFNFRSEKFEKGTLPVVACKPRIAA